MGMLKEAEKNVLKTRIRVSIATAQWADVQRSKGFWSLA